MGRFVSLTPRAAFTGLAFLCLGAASPPSDPVGPAQVAFVKQGHGWLLTDTKGMTLYTFTRDQEPGKSACMADCATTWPPLLAPADVKPVDGWTLIKRADGAQQWAFQGQPLYTYSRDVSPHDSYGDDVNRQWHVALKPIPTPIGIGTNATLIGHVLTDRNAMTLYVSDKDKAGRSNCDAACAQMWIPIEMPWMGSAIDPDWSSATRPDGTKQWAYKGRPLYAYAGDVSPGETLGDGVGKSWHAVVLQAPPPVPDWVSLSSSDAGELYVDAEGRTLYQHETARRGGRRRAGDARQMEVPQDWKPVLAKADAKSVGNWSIVTNADGTKQWAYKGLMLFTNVWDKQPGDLHGIRSSDRTWHTIMRSGQPMQGTGF